MQIRKTARNECSGRIESPPEVDLDAKVHMRYTQHLNAGSVPKFHCRLLMHSHPPLLSTLAPRGARSALVQLQSTGML